MPDCLGAEHGRVAGHRQDVRSHFIYVDIYVDAAHALQVADDGVVRQPSYIRSRYGRTNEAA